MKPDGSLDAPFTLDDDPPSHVPAPTVRRRHRQTLDQDGLEEISDAQQAAAAWKEVAARRQTKQRHGKNMSNDTSGGDSSTKDSNLTNKPRDRTSSSTKSVEIVDLSIDEDEPPVSGQATQSGASTRVNQRPIQGPQGFVPLPTTRHEAVLPERAKPAESPKRTSRIFSLPMESLATPAYHSHHAPLSPVARTAGPFSGPSEPSTTPTYHSHFVPSSSVVQATEPSAELSRGPSANPVYQPRYLPRPSVTQAAGPSAEVSKITPLNRSPSATSTPRTEPNVTTQAILEHENLFPQPTDRATSALGASTDRTAPVLDHAVDPSAQPTSDISETPREQAPFSRGDTVPESDDATPDDDSGSMTIPLPNKSPEPSFSAIQRLPQKQKAIKSVRRRDDGFSGSQLPVRSPRQSATDHRDVTNLSFKPLDLGSSKSRSGSPVVTRRSQSKTPTIDTSIIADSAPVQTEEESVRAASPVERSTTPTQSPPPPPHDEAGETAPGRAISSTPLLSRSATPTALRPVEASAEPTRPSEAPLPVPEIMIPDVPAPATVVSAHPTIQPEHLRVPVENDGGRTSKKPPLQADVLVTTRSAVEACLKRHVAERHELHAYLMETKMRNQRTFQEQDLRARSRKQKRPQQPILPERYIQKTSPFENMRAIQVPFDRANAKRLVDMSQETFIKAKPKDTVVKSGLAVPTTKYKSDAPKIPPFKEYVSLRNNVLKDNESKLLATPYFQDEDYRGREVLLDTLPYMYEMTHDEKGPLDFRKEQCRFYDKAIEAFLSEVGITWNDILFWLLAQDEDLVRINDSLNGSKQFEAQLLERSRYHIEEFERDGEPKKAILFDRNNKKWEEFVAQLEEPIPSALRLAATASAAVFKECEFSIWYLAQQSKAVQSLIRKKSAHEQSSKHSTYKKIMCRVCHQHDCLLHGEIRQIPEDSWKTDSEDEERATQATDDTSRRGSNNKTPRRVSNFSRDDTDDENEPGDPLPAHFDSDSDIEKVINYKLPANPSAFESCSETEMITPKGAKPPPEQEVDATYMGNKLRFINNADDKYTNCGPKNLLCNTVFRIALFATRDIKAGTELFFNYNYPKEKTEQFKQPNAKIVAVKQTKQKTKKRESLTSLSQPIEDRSRILAATAKAREAKAAKRKEAMLQEGGGEPATRRRSGTLQARKAATSKPGRKAVRKSKRGGLNRNESTGSDTGMDVEASDPEIPEIPPVIESQSTQTSLYVQDTEAEDDEFILPDTQEDEEQDVAEPASEDDEPPGRSTRSRRGPGRPRRRASDVAPVVAVKQAVKQAAKQKKSKMGGARPGAGRKRKRPVIANSDDE
ncbi:uncharacterized protein J4E84_009621 [Alternaria hordeiaustralica]|uniref:uncharacterized protein n=1 Tax=Alternaria hordeiaustralica TaxID=1187925 RepID=UPI0020C3F53F|nr:uncharacterized protein J4E84_009621 [Alternaria hordeiaustralica]KAI4676224.1 hypothetical protein J4E84_009621 [Alternaria hordeiaustralica]